MPREGTREMASKNRSWLYWLAAALVVALVATALLRSTRGNLTIGSVLVLTGEYKSLGEQIRDGQLIAAEELNADPARSRKIELLFQDSQGDKDLALEKVKSLQADGVRFIGEIFGSGPALNCLPFIANNDMVLVSGVDTGPDLTVTTDPKLSGIVPSKHFFRIIPSDTAAAHQLVRWAIDRGETKAAVVFLNDTWGSALKNALERSYKAAGGTIVATQEVGQGQDVFQPVVAALASESPQVVFLFIHPREAALLLVEARKRGLQARFAGTDNLTGSEFADLGGQAVEGVGYVAPGTPERTAAWHELSRRYQQKFGAGKEPPLFTVMGYDAIHVLVRGVDTGDGDVNRAITALEQTKYEGASGPISFDGNHDVIVRDYQRMVYKPVDGRMQASAEKR